jgi:16S rRNA processing protein RimM
MTRPADSGNGKNQRVVLGKVSGIYGVSGWVRIHSYTHPRQNIFLYAPWLVGRGDEWTARTLEEEQKRGKSLIAKLDGVDDRDQARALIGQEIAVYRTQMPDLPEGEFYWFDLMDMEVVSREGEVLGKVSGIQETGANDVLVVTGERRYLIPLILERYVLSIEPEQSRIVVDWDLRG